MKAHTAVLWIAAAAAPVATAGADAAAFVAESCAGCHALERPNYDAMSLSDRAERGGPPLYYAGNKFQGEWLERWLQSPERIRPAGDYPPAHVETTDDGDQIDTASLDAHPSLGAERAATVADYLMTLRPYDDRLAAVNYEPGNISWRMGQMAFGKFNNCIACHQDEPGYGGVSGPELYTAWDRLQPAFIASYIEDPTVWDPHTLMPADDLNEAAIAKLANYLKVLAEEE